MLETQTVTRKHVKVTKLRKGESLVINGVVIKANRRVTIRAESAHPISLTNLDNQPEHIKLGT